MSGLLLASDHDLLLRLLRTPTTSPLEAGGPTQLWQAQTAYAEAARAVGFRTARHDCARPADVLRDDVPAVVRAAAGTPGFLAGQPSLVLRLGRALPFGATIMVNVHLDTAAGPEPVAFDGSRFTGRGAVDAKGPAVALLAGVRQALQLSPAVGRDVGVVLQVVPGAGGGALGRIGTRRLIDAGFHGRLNVFCAPTGLRYVTSAPAEMTARVRADAEHDASVLLGFLAQHFAAALGGRCRVTGLRTDPDGGGEFLLTLTYSSAAEGAELAGEVERLFRAGLDSFGAKFGPAESTDLDWPKRGLPCLNGGDRWAENLLTTHAGLTSQPTAPCCDAIWMDGVPGAFTAVLGPGTPRTRGEYVDLAELDAFAGAVSRIVLAFARVRAPARRA